MTCKRRAPGKNKKFVRVPQSRCHLELKLCFSEDHYRPFAALLSSPKHGLRIANISPTVNKKASTVLSSRRISTKSVMGFPGESGTLARRKEDEFDFIAYVLCDCFHSQIRSLFDKQHEGVVVCNLSSALAPWQRCFEWSVHIHLVLPDPLQDWPPVVLSGSPNVSRKPYMGWNWTIPFYFSFFVVWVMQKKA